jgi:uncharacterized SAM-binding protein YcdF (DUF218 family)
VRILAVLLLALVLWGGGLVAFAARVAHSTPAADPPKAEGLVVLTGMSNQRIEAGMRLLRRGKAQRMLVSGVNRDATRADIKRAARTSSASVYNCCVDLGFEAEDTIGNARETAEWVRARGYDSLIVVTADYHMPRALLELRSALPRITVIPYPVATNELNARRWWRSQTEARRMVVEYVKYLVILGRETALRLAPRARPDDAAPSSQPT